jgi:5-methylcytosine-specific restriction endonuclease McrA
MMILSEGELRPEFEARQENPERVFLLYIRGCVDVLVYTSMNAVAKRQSAAARGYGPRWRKARLTYLRENPLCVLCLAFGQSTPATVVDHKTPHKGSPKLFWSQSNWQSLCKTCHDAAKQAEERTGWLRGADKDGVPLDAGHHWHGGPKP